MKNEIKNKIARAFKEAKTKQEVIDIWEQDKRVGVPTEAKRMFCSGCRQSWYNRHEEGGCMYLKKAKLKQRKIYPTLDSTKPDDVVTLNCYTQEYH